MNPGKIYDSFPEGGKNMTREAFIKEFQEAVSPQGIQRDLAAIQLAKARERTERILIDRAIGDRNAN